MLHPSTISPELTNSGLRAPEPSPMRAPRDTRPNSDDEDDDDVQLTYSQSRTSAEAGQHNEARSVAAASSSQPKADDAAVQAAAGARAQHMPFNLSLTLRNTGSVARDHLASERTFLAYVRTSLSFASAGVGLSLPSSAPLHLFLMLCSYIVYISSSTVVPCLRERQQECP